ncbi:hypothetical protein [Flavobacterium aquicola]|uniref:Uncharacterized protein n=1 Tax=Flavobacterium aquicola TaxID=1682742 RepID=A0A3E0DVX7_9FLAO|nr:hypothetical protein [Flavobacterium aquicola]REG88764.1 hypothetical protein C8P67_1284 [Flavobacterium aquicola]
MNDFFKIITKVKILILFVLFTQNTFSQKSVASEKYKTKKDKINIVFVPFFNKETDEQFTFYLNQGRFTIADTTKTSQNLRNEFLKNSWFKNFIDGFDQNLKSEKNLFANVTENEIKDFKINTLNSDLIYIHSAIESKIVTKINKSGNITLYFTIAVYDLESGEFIFKCKAKSKSEFKNSLADKSGTIKTLTQDLFACFEEKFK